MNCDQAFDVLTSPHRSHSASLQAHLAGCPRCRQMQATLEPALHLFDNVLADPWDLPPGEFANAENSPAAHSSPAFLSPETVRVAERAAAQLVPIRVPQTNPHRIQVWGKRFAAVGLVGSVFLLGLFFPTSRSEPPVQNCTRELAATKITGSAETVRAVVLSCVACHIDRQQSLDSL